MIYQTEPPSGKEIRIVIDMAPVSLQARRRKKDVITAAIQKMIAEAGYVLSGEVEVIVEWFVHERIRYETLASPDVDNALKVILDALSGPKGILINDCQVQSVTCRWIDWTSSEQQVIIRIRFAEDEWLSKEGLRFVRIQGPLCFPVSAKLSAPIAAKLLEHLQRVVQFRNAITASSGDWYAGQTVMPVQRFFHVGRLRGFATITADQLLLELNHTVQGGGSLP